MLYAVAHASLGDARVSFPSTIGFGELDENGNT